MKKALIKISLLGLAVVAVAVIPGNSQLVFGYGTPPTFAGSTTNPPSCGKEKPGQVVLYEPNHALLPKAADPNQVRLNWQKVSSANKYTIAFGLSSGNYIYGLPDVGDTDHFTVNNLTQGQKYYFVVRGVNECMAGSWSREWSVRIGGGVSNANVSLLTNMNTNSRNIITPPNIPTTPFNGGVNPVRTNVQQPPVQTQPTTFQPYTGPQPTVAPQPGFFQGLWKGFMGMFGL